ncbi:PEP-CTERM sorting domain-containing protein [Lentisalinibacter orientalis]|uniref:PEP-CTERM sorting domain-containing protein n=1 Tax=Lentisalinibacter orientalis TaxID=2992241 RepID=UPI00386EC222
MKATMSLILTLTLMTGIAHADPIIWSESDGGNGNAYEVIDHGSSLTWEEASALAESMGGYLVSLTSEAENSFVAELVSGATGPFDSYWLGGYQSDLSAEPDGGWAWASGEYWDPVFAASRWASGEPNNGVGGTQHYLHFWPSLPLWDDMDNRNTMTGYVVEYSKVPEPGTLGLLGLGMLAVGVARRRRNR